MTEDGTKLYRGIRNGTLLAVFAWALIFAGGWALYKQYSDVKILHVLHPDRMHYQMKPIPNWVDC